MIKQILLYSIILLMLISCTPKAEYSDHYAPMISAYVQRITIEIEGSQKRIYSITNKQEIRNFIHDLESSKENGAWMGAKWDLIVLHYADGREKVFSTNGKVFGPSSSGIFYDLNEKYQKYWEK